MRALITQANRLLPDQLIHNFCVQFVSPGRPDSDCLIDAENDIQAAAHWLNEFKNSPMTLAAYEKESRRFLIWLMERGQSFSELTRADITEYENFMRNPLPAEKWQGAPVPFTLASGDINPNWRPFVRGQLSENSIRQGLTILQGLFDYLQDAGYLRRNPFALVRQKGRKHTIQTPQERYLKEDAWSAVWDTILDLPQKTESQLAGYHRSRWLLALLYLTGARRHEVASGNFGTWFIKDKRWWWRVTGKGNKTADIPIPEDLVAEMKIYRRHMDLPMVPVPGEDTPLITTRRKRPDGNRSLNDRTINAIVKDIFMKAVARVEGDHPEVAVSLRQASSHWLRHTNATMQVKGGADLLMVNKNLRHGKLETTRRYVHQDDELRHDAAGLVKLKK